MSFTTSEQALVANTTLEVVTASPRTRHLQIAYFPAATGATCQFAEDAATLVADEGFPLIVPDTALNTIPVHLQLVLVPGESLFAKSTETASINIIST